MKKLCIIALVMMFTVAACGLELVRQKNVATYISFPIVDANGTNISDVDTPDTELDFWSDGAAPDGFADATNEIVEIGTTGNYSLSMAQGELNYDYIFVWVKVAGDANDAIDQRFLIRTTVGDPLNLATTDDGGTINVTGGAVDEASTMSAAGIDEIMDDLLTNNKIKNSLGYYVTRTKGGQPVDIDVLEFAQNGGTANTIVLVATSTSEDAAYRHQLVELKDGPGAPATRTIIAYDGVTKVATVNENWPGDIPNSSTKYTTWAAPSSNLAHDGLAQAGDATTITLATDAPDVNDISGWIKLSSGTGAPDTQDIASYNGTTKVLTVSGWGGDSPSTDTYYAIVPFGSLVSDSVTPTAGITSEEVKAAVMSATFDGYTGYPGSFGWLCDLLMRKP